MYSLCDESSEGEAFLKVWRILNYVHFIDMYIYMRKSKIYVLLIFVIPIRSNDIVQHLSFFVAECE